MLQQQSDSPILSICIPAYNRPIWLRRALLSAIQLPISQQFKVEIVVSDDSTLGSCQQVCHDLLVDWQGCWQYQANLPALGMAANWNRCIQMATGNYVLLLHDDDYLEIDAPSQILEVLQQNPDAITLLFGVNVVTPEQKIIKQQVNRCQQFLHSEAALEHVLTNSSAIRFPGMIIRRKTFEKVGYFNETIGGLADIHMWIRICHEYGLLCVPIVTANYTVHANALTMKMFTPLTVKGLETIFNHVANQQWLAEETLQKCRVNYFHQFILAGTVRYLKSAKIEKAKEVFSLFSSFGRHQNQVAIKWKIIRAALKVLLACATLFTSAPQSSEVS